MSAELVYDEVEIMGGIYSGKGFATSIIENLLTNDESIFDFINGSINIYDLEWHFINTFNMNIQSEVNLICPYGSGADNLILNNTYYITRNDNEIPNGVSPEEVEIILEETEPVYKIHNGETFDKLYTAETVDKKINDLRIDVPELDLSEYVKNNELDAKVREIGDTYYATKEQIGDIESALDAIIALQNSYTGGDEV